MSRGELLEAAYVLHRRQFRESSALLEVLTRDHGRISVISRGLRRSGKSLSKSALLQPFVPLVVSWTGKGEMYNLTGCESRGPTHALKGNALVSGFYMNELMYRLIHKADPHQGLFDYYQQTLTLLEDGGKLDLILRGFELKLLDEIGYGLNLDYEVASGDDLDPAVLYWYSADRGAFRQRVANAQQIEVSGGTLINLRDGSFDAKGPEAAKDARDFMRFVLSSYLGGRKLKSRELFVETKF